MIFKRLLRFALISWVFAIPLGCDEGVELEELEDQNGEDERETAASDDDSSESEAPGKDDGETVGEGDSDTGDDSGQE